MGSESKSLAVVTPSYRRDYHLCRSLNESIIRWMPTSVQHHIIVPTRDISLFRDLETSRTVIHDVGEFLPSHLVKIPGVNAWINVHRPWPPLRGWITQQLVKLSVSASLQVDGVLLVDSDMVFVADCDSETFSQDGQWQMYRRPGAIHNGMPEHRRWLSEAHSLLALDPVGIDDLTDYICWPCLWEPAVVRLLLQRIEEVSEGIPWETTIGSRLHFSEMMLYGAFVDGILGGAPATVSTMKSICYSDEASLNLKELKQLLKSGPADAVAVMVSAKANIAPETRSAALEQFRSSRGAQR